MSLYFQYHFFKNYLQPDNPLKVCKDCVLFNSYKTKLFFSLTIMLWDYNYYLMSGIELCLCVILLEIKIITLYEIIVISL